MPLRSRMAARDLAEPHRVSSPLELLFDLTFVAAVSQASGRLAHATGTAHTGDAVAPFLMVFFAIWWAWMNFTWYGLFTIILLGESVLASTNAVQDAVEHGLHADLVTIALAGLAILFALWWIYFSEPAGEGLERHRDRSFVWGYGHYLIFAALAAIGAGLEVAVASAGGHTEAGTRTVVASVAVPVAVVLVMIWALHAPMRRPAVRLELIGATAVLVVLIPFAAPTIGVPASLVAVAALLALLLATTLVREALGGVTARRRV